MEVRDTLVCAGTSIDLTSLVSDYGSLLSSVFTIGDVDGTLVNDPSAFVANNTVTLTLVASNLLGCTDTTTLTVSVAPLLDLSASVSDTLVCAGTVLDLNALVPGIDTLLDVNFLAGGVAVVDPLAFVANSTTTLTLVASNLLGCTDTTTLTVSVAPLLDLSASVSDTLVCAGTVLDLNALVPGIDTLLDVNFLAGGVAVVDPLAFVANSTTTLTLVASNLLGCTDTTTLTVSVAPLLDLSASVSDTLVCAGTVLDLNALVPGIDTLLDVNFLAGGVAVVDPLAFVANSTTTLTLVASNLLGCTDTTTLTVSVAPLLDLSASVSDTLVCAGTVLDLNALVPGIDTLLDVNFLAGGVAVVDPLAFVANSTTTLTLVASNLLGCTDTTTLTVSVAPLLDLSASVSDTLVCAGTVLDLNALVPGIDTLLNVSFRVNGQPVTNPSAFVADITVTIQVTASTVLGCSDTKPLVVTVSDCNQTTDLSLNKSVDRKLAMLGDTVSYTIRVVNQGTGAATGVEVTDSLNVGVQYVGSSSAAGSYNPTTRIWSLGSLAVGDSATLSIRVRVVAQGVWFNTAEISKMNEEDEDSTPGNGIDGEDDIDRECFTVPVLVCRGQGTAVDLMVPAEYTGVVWFRKTQGGQPVQVATGNTFQVVESELGTYEYTFTSTSGTCPAEGCCPTIVVVQDCCPVDVCVPFTITRKVR